jgi:hypothetical protein
MRLSHRLAVAVGAIGLGAGALAAALAASAAWVRVSGPTEPGAQLGLARGADGVLHVIWNRGTPKTSILETRFSPAGKAIGTSTVSSDFGGNGGLALLVMPDTTLRLFAAGAPTSAATDGGIGTFTAPASGGSWTPQSGALWGGPVAEASGVIGATLTKDGQPVTAWRGFAAEGIPPGSIPQDAFEGDMTESFVTTDAASGAVVLGGETISGQGGAYVQQILPSPGPKVVLGPLAKDWSNGLSARIGAPGVYVAYADGKAARLYRYGGGSKILATGGFLSATVCAGPEGRLWVAWGDLADGLFVTRSNRAVSAFEPVQRLKTPSNVGVAFLQCEGSAGPVDLFADSGAGGAGFWHTHLPAQLSLRGQAAKGRVTLSARDAGDPIAGVSISVGGKRVQTDPKGQAALALRAGTYSATATAAGYAPASIKFSVR